MKRCALKKRAISALALAAGLLLCACAPAREAGALFSWKRAAVCEERAQLFSLMQAQGLDTLYQAFSGSLAAEESAAFLREAAEREIEVYLLCGAPEWALEADGASLCAEIARAAALGGADAPLAGVVADVEPHLLAQWEEAPQAVMARFVSGMRAACAAARENGLELIVCIPYYYDSKGLDEPLAALIAEGCDAVAVMNYYRGKEQAHIETEAALAARYGKGLINIYELQPPGEHGLVPENTYYGEGLAALRENFAALREAYPGISMALHEYGALKEATAHE